MSRKTQHRRPLLSRLGEALDRLVLAVSPERGARRIVFRNLFARQQSRRDEATDSGGGFKGADNDRLYGHRWLTRRLSAASREELDQEDLRIRSREIYMNTSAGGAVDSRVNNVVGCGFRPQAKIKPLTVDGVVLVTEDEAQAINERLDELYVEIEPRLSVDRRRSLWQQTRLMAKHLEFDGEGLAVLSDVGDADQRIPLAIEVADPDRLQTPPELEGNPLVRMGVERDKAGRIVKYHLRRTHPDDTKDVDLEFDHLPAERVAHVYDPWFAGQNRGLPCYTRVLDDLRNAADLDEASIISAQIQAMNCAFVTSSTGASRAAIGAGRETNSRGQRLQEFEPGGVKYLDSGEDVKFNTPNPAASTYAPFMEWIYRRIAAGMNFVFEMFAKNWSGVSFAGGRLVLTEARLDAESRQKLLKELFLRLVWERMVTEAVILGEVDLDPRLFNRHRRHFLRHDWIAPAFPYAINPEQEANADIKLIDHNLDTRANRLAARGLDIDEVDAQRQRERASERDLDIEPPDHPPTAEPAAETEQEAALAAT